MSRLKRYPECSVGPPLTVSESPGNYSSPVIGTNRDRLSEVTVRAFKVAPGDRCGRNIEPLQVAPNDARGAEVPQTRDLPTSHYCRRLHQSRCHWLAVGFVRSRSIADPLSYDSSKTGSSSILVIVDHVVPAVAENLGRVDWAGDSCHRRIDRSSLPLRFPHHRNGGVPEERPRVSCVKKKARKR